MQPVFGRTNEDVPRLWLSPRVPRSVTGPHDLEALAESLLAEPTVIDPSSGPSLWGSLLRGKKASFMLELGREYERAVDSDHAATLVQSSLLSLLSCLGRDQVDFVFLPVWRVVEESQIAGALEGLELARQEGLVRFFGLSAKGPGLAVLSFWQFHDAFEVLMTPRDPSSDGYETLASLAHSRRVAVAARRPLTLGGRAPLVSHPLVQQAAEKANVDPASALIAWHARDSAVRVGVSSVEEAAAARAWPSALSGADAVRSAAVQAWGDGR